MVVSSCFWNCSSLPLVVGVIQEIVGRDGSSALVAISVTPKDSSSAILVRHRGFFQFVLFYWDFSIVRTMISSWIGFWLLTGMNHTF